MLTLSTIKNASGAAKYYAKEDNYYLAEADAKETSKWWGKGAAELRLSGKVEQKELQKLLNGVLPNGVTIGLQKDGTIKHRPGYDLCFHAPKSVSILALDGEDKRFYDAHLEAVEETLKLIERDCAQAKVFQNEKISFENTKNLVVALVRHTTSREQDLHLHHHALVMNVTERQDNGWRALASNKVKEVKTDDGVNGFFERVYNNQIYYGLIYKTALANKVQELGCEIEEVGKHGMWEIKGVPQEARDIMSKRRRQIEERMAELGQHSLRAADVVALEIREEKPKNMKLDELRWGWRDELASVGFSSKEFIAELDNRVKEMNERGANENSEHSAKASENSKETKEAVINAIEHLSQYNLKLGYEKIITQALEFSIGKSTHSGMINALNDAVKDGVLIPVDKSNSMFVTNGLIETEKAIMDMVDGSKGGKEKSSAIDLNVKELDNIAAGSVKNCAIDVLQSKDRLNLVETKLADNTEFVSVVLKLAEASGKTVRILSPNRIMANDINENIKRKPSNLWQWLVSLGKPELGETVAGFKHKYKEELELPLFRYRQGKDVIIVHSAETLGCGDTRELPELTAKSNAKVIFLCDLNSKQGVSAGNSLATLKQAGIATFKIDANERNEKTKNYVPELIAIEDNEDRTKRLAQVYAAKDDNERANTRVILGSKEQLKATNVAIREELKDRGKISTAECSVSVLNPVYLSKPEAALAHRYQKNMILRFYDNNHAPKDWSIESINKEQNILRLVCGKERMIWDPKQQQEKQANHTLFKKDELHLAKGDKLVATGNMKSFGVFSHFSVKNGAQCVVQDLDNKRVKLLFGTKTIKINLQDLENSHFRHDYATTMGQYSKKPTDHILLDVKAYVLDKDTISTLTNRAQKSLTIFTNDAEAAQKRFGHIPVKLTAAETLLEASMAVEADVGKVDRFIDNKAITEIKSDIERAVMVLREQYGLAEKTNAEEKAEKKAVDFALGKITHHNAGFTHKELVTEALEFVLREQVALRGEKVTHEDIVRVITEKRAAGELVMGKHFDDGTRWTTKEILELERSIITDMKKGQNKLSPIMDHETAKSLIDNTNLTQGQKDGCKLITTAKDQFVMIQGYTGVGKSTMFVHVKNMLGATEETKGIEMIGVAPTNKAVRVLRDIGIEAQTLQSFIVEQQKKQKEENEAINPEGYHCLDNKLIVLDEFSMVSNKDYADFSAVVRNSKAWAVLSGDVAQHISPGSGKPIDIIQKANVLQTVYLREVVRQKNLNLKSAVEDVIQKKYGSAFDKIAAENPQEHIERIEKSQPDFFDTLKTSIVEIDNENLKAGESSLEETLAQDFLSRTPEVRSKTVVIVHANDDRRIINGHIRNGLKEQGEIAQQGIEVSCLISKGLSDAEHKYLQSYNVGDVVKMGKEYYHVIENDNKSKSLLLKNEEGKTKFFYPKKHADKYNVELYEHIKDELAVGDTIRFTKTDKKRERYANFEYQVTEIKNDAVILENKDSKISLDPKKLKDAHWDYAYTVTGYGVQGDSKSYVIDYEPSYRRNLANQRSFYIAISRAIHHVTIYTNDKLKLMRRIFANKGDKYAAIEVTGELDEAKDNSKHDSTAGDKVLKGAKNAKTKEYNNRSEVYDAKEISEKINNIAESFVERLLGRPNEKLSSGSEWRYGSKGSLVIKMSGDRRGLWHNFETGESGNLLTLIQKETGLAFRETLKYAANVVGGGLNLSAINQNKRDKEPINSNNPSTKVSNKENKTKEYAQKLAVESKPIGGTIVEKYLKDTRGINNIDSSDIRYHPKVYTGKSEKQKYAPAMLAIGRDKDGNIQCVQATYLNPKTANKADLDVKKRTYASPSGASVALQSPQKHSSLSPGGDFVESLESPLEPDSSVKSRFNKTSYIAEGVETGLSIKDALKSVKNSEVQVTLGKSNFASIDPRSVGQKVVFCLDNDGVGSFADGAIHKAAQCLVDAGKSVFIAIPAQIDNAKTDFNDVARIKGIGAVKDHIDSALSYAEFSKNFKLEDKTIGNDLVSKSINNNRDAVKQLDNVFGKNKITSSMSVDQISKNIQQSDRLNKQTAPLQVHKGVGLNLEI